MKKTLRIPQSGQCAAEAAAEFTGEEKKSEKELSFVHCAKELIHTDWQEEVGYLIT